jgi:hypothetical protein
MAIPAAVMLLLGRPSFDIERSHNLDTSMQNLTHHGSLRVRYRKNTNEIIDAFGAVAGIN